MAGEVERLSGKLGIDTTDFKTAIAAANRELRVLESGFKASAAALGDWTKDASGLESRVKSLTGQIDIQTSKVDALAAEHARLVQAHGENSRAAQDAEIKLNKETETLNRMQTELASTETSLADMATSEDEAGDAADDLGEKSETLRGILAGLGVAAAGVVTAIAAVGAAAAAAVAAIAGIALKAADTAEQLTDLSNQTGISTTRLQELKYAGEILGTSLDTITGAQARLVRSMYSAKDGTGSQAEAFKALGVSATDANGNLRNTQAVFSDVIDALGNVKNPAEADALAMQLFGKSAQELNPLIKAGSSELARLSTQAHNMGAVMSEEGVAAASAFKDQLDALKMGFEGVVNQIGLAFIPGLSGIADEASGYLRQIVGVVQGADGDIGKMAQGLGDILGRIVTDLAKQAPQMAQVGIELVQSILDAILSALPTLIPAGVSLINTLIDFIVQNLPLLVDAAVQIISALVQGILPQLPLLVEAALQIIITLANGITQMLPTLIPTIVDVVVQIVQTLVENLPLLIDAALQLILALAEGLIAALPVLIPAIPQIVGAIVEALIVALPQIVVAAVELILALAQGILSNLPLLLQAVVQIIEAVVKAFAKADWPAIGKSFIDGIINGWNANWTRLVSNITANFAALVDYIKQLLGIASPSKVFSGIGENMALGLSGGWSKSFADFNKQMAFSMQALGSSAAGGSVSNSNVQNDSFQFFAPVVLQGDTPTGSLGARLKGRRY